MQDRNRQMRSDAKLHNKNLMLQEKVMEQQEEIKQLRQHLRDMFEDQEDKIVTASYSNTAAMAPTDVTSPELHQDVSLGQKRFNSQRPSLVQ